MQKGDLVLVTKPAAIHSGAIGLVHRVPSPGYSLIWVTFAGGRTGYYLLRDLEVVAKGATKAQRLALKQLAGLV